MRKYCRRFDNGEEVNINIVPLIDILFSIMITFMIPTQSLFGSLGIELPSADAKIVVLKKDPIKVLINKDGDIIIDGQEVKMKNLSKKINELSLKDKNIKIYVMADKRNNYGRVLDITGKLNKDGFNDVVLISDLYNRL